MAGALSPTVRRRELGVMLRALRTDSGLTVEQVADKLLWSPSKVSRLETGRRGANQRDVRNLCAVYGITDPQQCQHLLELAREARASAWWTEYELPYDTYVGLESGAIMIRDFDPGVFPGLLQTPEYALALHEGAFPRLPAEVIAQRIEVRRLRQQALVKDDPPILAAIVDEAVLHRVVGGPRGMAGQLVHVIEACRQGNISVQVIPYSAGAHPALDSTFIILDFASPLPPVVYVEGLVGQIYLERTAEVQRYETIYGLLTEIAMSPDESIDVMAEVLAKYRQEENR